MPFDLVEPEALSEVLALLYLCRCGSYPQIVQAVKLAAQKEATST
jgi:aerobic-type carbon monoxide dehydrogenase small subunit (CoxS/CutS family)